MAPLLRPSTLLSLRPFHTSPIAKSLPLSHTLPCRSASPTTSLQSQALQQTHNFSTTTTRHSDSHESHYDPPSGWLFGVKPGQKYVNEGWETIWYWGFFGSLGLAVVAYAFKPDTSIQTWALEEARRRLEAEGILKEPEDKP